MTTDRELTAAVASQSGAGEDEARAGLTASLEAPGPRLAGGSVDELAAALPAEAADALRRGRTPAPQQGSLTDIAQRGGAGPGGAAAGGATLVRASLRAIAGAVDEALPGPIREHLP